MKNEKGFTLIELLATIAILGLLATIAGISITKVLNKSKDNVNNIQENMVIEAAKAHVTENVRKYKECRPPSSNVTCADRNQECLCLIKKPVLDEYLDNGEDIRGCVFLSIKYSNGKFLYRYESDNSMCSLDYS